MFLLLTLSIAIAFASSMFHLITYPRKFKSCERSILSGECVCVCGGGGGVTDIFNSVLTSGIRGKQGVVYDTVLKRRNICWGCLLLYSFKLPYSITPFDIAVLFKSRTQQKTCLFSPPFPITAKAIIDNLRELPNHTFPPRCCVTQSNHVAKSTLSESYQGPTHLEGQTL